MNNLIFNPSNICSIDICSLIFSIEKLIQLHNIIMEDSINIFRYNNDEARPERWDLSCVFYLITHATLSQFNFNLENQTCGCFIIAKLNLL